MEIRLREGNGLICEVSGAEENALIKLQTAQGETPWMGIEALKKAYKILAPIAGQPTTELAPVQPKLSYPPGVRSAPPAPEFYSDDAFAVQQPAPVAAAAQPAQRKLSAADIEALKEFQDSLVELIENPPPMREGQAADGVSEADIRRLISDHQNRFRDPFALYPILQRHLGMSRERFASILQMIKKPKAV